MGAKTKKRKSTNGRNVRSRRKKPTNLHEKDRNYFFGDEIEQLLEEAKGNRYGIRDQSISVFVLLCSIYRAPESVTSRVDVPVRA